MITENTKCLHSEERIRFSAKDENQGRLFSIRHDKWLVIEMEIIGEINLNILR